MSGDAPPKLTVICGCMFSGKTTALIAKLNASQDCGVSAQAFKHSYDVRYARTHLVSHDNIRAPARAVSNSTGIMDSLSSATKLVVIDEGQFFDHGLVDVAERLVMRGVQVIIAGLDLDYLGRSFGPIGDLLCHADDVVKMQATCRCCGQQAIHSQRLHDQDGLISVGGSDSYEARCRRCFRRTPP